MKIYSMVGTSVMVTDDSSRPSCPEGYIEMQGPRPTDEHVAQADGSWTLPRLSHDEVWTAIKLLREEKEAGGLKVEFEGETLWFNSDEKSRIKLLVLKEAGEAIPEGLEWKTLPNGFVTLTPTLARAITQALLESDAAIFAAAEAHRQAMLALDDPGDYDYSSGWPENYADVLERQAAEAAAAESVRMTEAMAAPIMTVADVATEGLADAADDDALVMDMAAFLIRQLDAEGGDSSGLKQYMARRRAEAG